MEGWGPGLKECISCMCYLDYHIQLSKQHIVWDKRMIMYTVIDSITLSGLPTPVGVLFIWFWTGLWTGLWTNWTDTGLYSN